MQPQSENLKQQHESIEADIAKGEREYRESIFASENAPIPFDEREDAE